MAHTPQSNVAPAHPTAAELPGHDCAGALLFWDMLNLGALLYDVPLLHRPVPIVAELRGITIKIIKQ
jgi:hypothetical protein